MIQVTPFGKRVFREREIGKSRLNRQCIFPLGKCTGHEKTISYRTIPPCELTWHEVYAIRTRFIVSTRTLLGEGVDGNGNGNGNRNGNRNVTADRWR
jgi:hypothetical protein